MFLSLLKAEFIKNKKGLIWIIVFAVPLILFSMLSLDWHLRGKYLILDEHINALKEYGVSTQWHVLFFENHLTMIWYMTLTLSLILLSVLINYVEYNCNTWKLILTRPVKRWKIYLCKWIFVVSCSFFLISLNILLVILVGVIFSVSGHLSIFFLLKYFVVEFIASIGIISIQQFISSYFSNSITSACIGIVGSIAAFMLSQNSILANIIPYCYVFRALPVLEFKEIYNIIFCGIISGVLWLFVGIVEFNNRDVR